MLCVALGINRWGWVFPCSIFNPGLNLKGFQRSLQTIVSVISKQFLPLPPFVSPPLIPFILTQPGFEALLVTSEFHGHFGPSPAPKQGSHPKSSCREGLAPILECVCASLQPGGTDRPRMLLSGQEIPFHYPSFVCRFPLPLEASGFHAEGIFPAVSPHSHIWQRPLAGSFPSPYINRGGEGEHPCRFQACGSVSESCQGCSCHN